MSGAWPPVAYISSSLRPSLRPSQVREWDPDDDAAPDGPIAGPSRRPAPSAADPPPRFRRGIGLSTPGSLSAPYPQKEAWDDVKEWYINPSGHGGRAGPPAFVRAQGLYDELGRRTEDGVGVEVIGTGDDEAEDAESKAGGDEVASWYRRLTKGKGRVHQSEAGGRVEPGRSAADEPPDRPREVIEVVDSSDDDDVEEVPRKPPPAAHDADAKPPLADPPLAPMSSRLPEQPIRIHSSEWFIRRALLRAHRARADEIEDGARARSSVGSSAASSPAPSSSISSLLAIGSVGPTQKRPPPAPQYAIGPDNRGYTMLKHLGWGGGGLGRPDGWDQATDADAGPPLSLAKAEPQAETNVPIDTDDEQPAGGSLAAAADTVIDLTADSDDASVADDIDDLDSWGDEDDPGPSGPGRTAPLATLLKLDRLGLGHRRTGSARVTHSSEQVEAARRRAKGVKVRKGKRRPAGRKSPRSDL